MLIEDFLHELSGKSYNVLNYIHENLNKKFYY